MQDPTFKPEDANKSLEEKEYDPLKERVPDSFQVLLWQHYPTVIRKLHALVCDQSVAEDLAQEVFFLRWVMCSCFCCWGAGDSRKGIC